jgi:ribosomal protein S18 acetylase RimI-like enzyme
MKDILFKIRKAKTEDYPFLRKMLYEAMFIPEGEEKPPFSVIDEPELHVYLDDWMKKTDAGFIAEAGSMDVGAAWARQFESAEKGAYGFIDADTPELCFAVNEQYRGNGIGTALMEALFAELRSRGYKRFSLSVDKLNRAYNLYQRLGFKVVKTQETDFLMLKLL